MHVHVHDLATTLGIGQYGTHARRGESTDCGAIIDVIRLLNVIPDPELAEAKGMLVRIIGMLSKMCR